MTTGVISLRFECPDRRVVETIVRRLFADGLVADAQTSEALRHSYWCNDSPNGPAVFLDADPIIVVSCRAHSSDFAKCVEVISELHPSDEPVVEALAIADMSIVMEDRLLRSVHPLSPV